MRAAAQKAVSAKLVRMTGWTAECRHRGCRSVRPRPLHSHRRHGHRAAPCCAIAPCHRRRGRPGHAPSPSRRPCPPMPPVQSSRIASPWLGIAIRPAIGTTEDPQVLHGDLVRLQQVVKPSVEARLGLGVMRPLPLPEELLDVRDVRAARDVFDGLVIDGQHRRARRTACRRGR